MKYCSVHKSKCQDARVAQGYTTVSANIIRFSSELHDVPIPSDLECLDEGSGIP